MATKKGRAAPKKDPREKLSAKERKALKPPPVDRGDFERVIRGLLSTAPSSKPGSREPLPKPAKHRR